VSATADQSVPRDRRATQSHLGTLFRAARTLDHYHLRYTAWKLWHGLDLTGVSADDLGFDSKLRGHANTGGPRVASVIRSLNLPADWSAVDIGSGKGGACFTLASFFNRVCGIELSPRLVEIAKSNQRKLGPRYQHITFIQENALSSNFDEFQFFYIANPFGSEVAQAVLANIEASVERRSARAVLIVYHPCVIEEYITPRLFKLIDVKRFRNVHPFYIFTTPSS
jgi:SAM-dependent methyltransferase